MNLPNKQFILLCLIATGIGSQALYSAPTLVLNAKLNTVNLDDKAINALQKETGLEEEKVESKNNRPRNFALIGNALAIGIRVLLQKTCPGLEIKFRIKDSLIIGSLGSLIGYATGKAVNRLEDELEKFETIDRVK
ncbi:hypothetical protein EBU24_05345 [bacterium]|nr:hypothetical protein [bacterium]